MKPNEIAVLGTLAGELVQLVQPMQRPDGEWLPDPALRRLFPDAYRDDAQASEDFRRFTQTDQAAAKVEAAQTVIADLQDPDGGWVTVPPDNITAWLITLTNLRLVMAERANKIDAIFDWCGWMLESMLDAVAVA